MHLSERPLILGHRGSPRLAVENTLRSLALAVEQGADGVELDVQRSQDGVPVVIHDPTLRRTMNARGTVSKLSWSAIERISAARVPSLEQVVAWAAASGAWLNVELKAPGLEAEVIRLLELTGLRERAVLSSFDPGIVRGLGDVDPRFRRFLLTERWDDQARVGVARSGAQGVCLGVEAATGPALRDLASRELPVVVWTVNDPLRMRELLGTGVAAIITDLPADAVRVRSEMGLG